MQVKNTFYPSKKYPILIIGAGGIVADAHLPAYKLGDFKVWVICDKVKKYAADLASTYQIENIFDSAAEAIAAAPQDVIYDIALPASISARILTLLPDGAHVLIQKPMGESLQQAEEILRICRDKKLHAAINCQMRFAPYVLAARQLIDQDAIGEINDIEILWTLF